MADFTPALRPNHVPRRRLIDLLASWRNLRLILITAPAGFGKSTFAAEWTAQLMHAADVESRPLCIWLNLGSTESTIELLLHDIVEALSVHLSDLDDLLSSIETGGIERTQFVRSLARRLGRSRRHIVIVLDDFHLLGDEARVLVQDLLDHAPPTLHLVLLSRTTPALRTARLQLNASVLTIDADVLRFDHDEFDAFAQHSLLAQFDPAQRIEIERRADGWIAGLHMLAQSKRTLLDEYTESEILQHIPFELRSFLTDVAPLPYMTPTLCAAATGRSVAECDSLIAAAESSVAFVMHITHAPSTIRHRIHPLLQEVLLCERARRTDCAPEDDLRRRGAEHLAALGDVDAALNLLPADEEAAAHIVTRALRPAMMRCEFHTARRWLQHLNPQRIAASPQLAVDATWLDYFMDMESMHIGATVNRMSAAVTHSTSDELRAEAAVLEALCHVVFGALEKARSSMDVAARMPHHPDGLAAGYIQLFEGYVPHDPSDAQARIRHMQRAADTFQRIGHLHGVIEAAVTQGYIKRRYANIAGAIDSLQHAFGVMKTAGRHISLFAADAENVCADMLYQMDRIPEAIRMYEKAQETIDCCRESSSSPLPSYTASVGLQLCCLAENPRMPPPDATEDARLWATVLASSIPTEFGVTAMLRIWRDQRLGLTERCWQTTESIAILPTELTEEHADMIWLAVLSGSVFSGRISADVEAQIVHFRDRMDRAHNTWLRLRADLLLTLCTLADSRCEEAEHHLVRLLPEIETRNVPRLILDCKALQPLVLRCPLPYAQRLSAHPTWKQPNSPLHPFGLSLQEMRVLKMLVAGKSIEDVALDMFLSAFTVRAHMRSIYKKLGAHSRAEAVRAAREAGVM